ncbi:MAG: TlpA family protein disulfide reductase [Nitriliruptorales bacterium]
MNNSRGPLVVAATALAVVVGSALVVGGREPDCLELPDARRCVELVPPSAREPAPTEAMPVLGEDDELGLPDLRGQVVVVNFWASWCGPCRKEQPDLNRAHERLAGEDVAFVGVDLQDSEANGLAHQREFAIPYPSLFDPASVYASKFRGVSPKAIPSTIIVDREGRVAVRLLGLTTEAELAGVVDLVVGEAS